MSEDMKKIVDTVVKDDEQKKEIENFIKENNVSMGSGNSWLFWTILLLVVAIPFGVRDEHCALSMDKQLFEEDKQQIAYLSGKIEAYEKMLRGE